MSVAYYDHALAWLWLTVLPVPYNAPVKHIRTGTAYSTRPYHTEEINAVARDTKY
jgi:hypothetical protein